MKKYFLALSAFLLTSMALVSCSSDSDDSNNGSNLAKVTLTDPAHRADAMKITLKEGRAIDDKIIRSIELTESGKYFIVYEPVMHTSRANSSFKAEDSGFRLLYLMGEFVKNGTTITLKDFGTISLDGETLSANLTIKVGDDEIVVPVTLTKVHMEDLMSRYLCRTWTIEKTRVRCPEGTAMVAKDFTGCNLYEMVEFARKYVTISDDFSVDKIVRGVTFTSANTFLINYADGSYDVGSWSWNGTPSVELQTGGVTYHWNADDMGSSFMQNGGAEVEFSGSQCKLTLKATIGGKNVEVVWTMK